MKTKIYFIVVLLSSFSMISQEEMNVYFDFDKYELNEKAIHSLKDWIAQNKNKKVTKLYGFCDWKGTNAYNDTLASKRVNQVYVFLKENGVEIQKNTEIRGFGEDFEQSKDQAKNRRVTLVYEEKLKSTSEVKEKVAAAKKGDLIKLKNLNFYNNSDILVPKSEPVLRELLAVMDSNPKLKIEIQGHICCKRPDQEDFISSARAKAVYDFLVKNKITKNRMTFKGYGVSKPIYKIPERNRIEEDENRRVQILIIEN